MIAAIYAQKATTRGGGERTMDRGFATAGVGIVLMSFYFASTAVRDHERRGSPEATQRLLGTFPGTSGAGTSGRASPNYAE